MLARAAIINGCNVFCGGGGTHVHEPRDSRNMGNEPRQRRMPPEEPGDRGCCNLEASARDLCCDKPRANHFPNFGGGGPSLRLSLRSRSRSSASISSS